MSVEKSCFANRQERIAAFENVDLYPVISSEFTLNRPVKDIFHAVAEGGAKIVQLREKNASMQSLYELACACRPIANEYGILLIIDDHIDIALAANADGVHLGQEDMPLIAARRIAPELLIGNSTHNEAEALAAGESKSADYINVGPIYPTGTKKVNCGALGIEAISRIAPLAKLPFTVMGGIKAHHIPELRAAGARRIAMVTEITQADDVTAKVKELRQNWF